MIKYNGSRGFKLVAQTGNGFKGDNEGNIVTFSQSTKWNNGTKLGKTRQVAINKSLMKQINEVEKQGAKKKAAHDFNKAKAKYKKRSSCIQKA